MTAVGRGGSREASQPTLSTNTTELHETALGEYSVPQPCTGDRARRGLWTRSPFTRACLVAGISSSSSASCDHSCDATSAGAPPQLAPSRRDQRPRTAWIPCHSGICRALMSRRHAPSTALASLGETPARCLHGPRGTRASTVGASSPMPHAWRGCGMRKIGTRAGWAVGRSVDHGLSCNQRR